jgi:LmbE family N-acetylglucosaminyl deacetylase
MDFTEIPRNVKRKCACIVVPHPDDFEILNAHTALALIHENYQIYEILMSGGEYGIQNLGKKAQRIKGKILQRMRYFENRVSKRNYGTFADGTPCVISIRMDYIDGFVPFSSKSVNRLKKLFQDLQPKIIVGPDPVYTTDLHEDHVATARITFFAVKSLPKIAYPKQFFLFQSFRNNFGMSPQSWSQIAAVNNAHRSQMTPISIKVFIFLMRYFLFPLRRNKTILRRYDVARFNSAKNWSDHIQTFRDKFVYAFTIIVKKVVIGTTPSLYLPLPAELGLKIDPEDCHIPKNA